MENQEKRYKKLYRFAAPLKDKSVVRYFMQFIEKSNNLSSLKLNMSVKKEVLNLDIFCNTQQDFEFINDDIFYFFRLGEIKNYFIRYYDLETGKFVLNPPENLQENDFHSQAGLELFKQV